MTRILVNIDTLDYYGVDFAARGYVHPRIELGGAYDFITTKDGLEPDRLPHHRAEAWIQAQAERRLAFNVRGRYYGKFIDQGMNLPAYTTLEATATATLSSEYMIVLRGDDLLNSRPETHAGYFGPGLVISLVLQGQWE